MITATGGQATLAPAEQRALLRIERSLGKDLDLADALRAFGSSRCCYDEDPSSEPLSPWHPFLWRAAPVALAAFTLTAVTLITLAVLGLI
jgi:hypothetical protein